MDAPSDPLPIDVNTLQSLVSDLQSVVGEQQSQLNNLKSVLHNKENQLIKLQEQLNLKQQRLFGRSTEKLEVEQLEWDFFNEAELLAALARLKQEKEPTSTQIEAPTRRGRQKKPFPKKLREIELIHDLSDDQKHCACGETLKHIGDDVSEQLAVIPLTYYVIKHIRRRYGCSCKQCLKSASMPASVLPGTQASAQLIAHIMVSKYLDGLPLYRQEKIAARSKIDLPRAKLARWLIDSSQKYLQPIYNLIQEAFWQYDIGHCDETRMQVLKEPERTPQNKSWLWLRRGGPPDKPVILVDYSPSRSGQVAGTLLDQFRGYLICDAYSSYRSVAKENDLLLVYCNDHARRRFVDIVKSIGKEHDVKDIIATRAVAWYKPLYALEKKIKHLSAEEKYRQRQQHAVAHWQKFLAWAQQLQNDGVQHNATREALQYLLNHAVELQRYCDDGRLPMTNIRAEHVAKTIAVARKNFLFAVSVAGAKASAMIYSILETANLNGHHPFEYVTVLLNEAAQAKTVEDYERLLPWNISPEQVRDLFKIYPAP